MIPSSPPGPHVREPGGAGGRGPAGDVVALSLATALLLLLPAVSAAQDPGSTEGSVAFELRGGGSVPGGETGLAVITEPGPVFGGGISIPLGRHLAVTGDVDYQLLQGDREDAGVALPDMDVLSATGGLEIHFREPGNPWRGILSLGAGVSSLRTAELLDDGTQAPVVLDASAFTARGGLKLGFQATPSISLYLEPGVYLFVLERDLTEPFVIVAPGLEEPFEFAWTIPLQAAIRIQF